MLRVVVDDFMVEVESVIGIGMEELNIYDVFEDVGIGVFELDFMIGFLVVFFVWKCMIGLFEDVEIFF